MPRNAKSNEQLYEEAEQALIGEAIQETEEEIAASAFDDAPDENTGDDSLEQMEDEGLDGDDQFDEDESEESEEAEGEEGEEGEDRQQPGDRQDDRQQDRQPDRRGVPPARLREESEARRAAEAERDAERQRLRALEAEIELLKRGGGQQRQQTQTPPEEPDIFADPDAWKRATRDEIVGDLQKRAIAESFEDTAEEHGQEALTAAHNSFLTACQRGDPVALATAQRIGASPARAGRIVMQYHERQSLLSEIGTDPNAYRQKVRDELLQDPDFRKQLLTGMREDAMRGDGGRPRTQTRLPPSLNAASGGTSHRGRDFTARTTKSVEQDIFDSAFDD